MKNPDKFLQKDSQESTFTAPVIPEIQKKLSEDGRLPRALIESLAKKLLTTTKKEKEIQALATLAIDRQCFIFDLNDLALILQQINSAPEAHAVAIALSEVLEPHHCVFLIKRLFSEYIKNLSNHEEFMNDSNPLFVTITSLVHRLIHLDQSIQDFFNANIKIFFDKIRLAVLDDYLQQKGTSTKQHILLPTTVKYIQSILDKYLTQLCNFSNDITKFPFSLRQILAQIFQDLQAHKIFYGKTSLTDLNDHLSKLNIEPNQDKSHTRTAEETKKNITNWLTKFHDFIEHNLTASFPDSLRQKIDEIIKSLPPVGSIASILDTNLHVTSITIEKALGLMGGYLVRILDIYIQDRTDKLLKKDAKLLANNFDQLFSENELKDSLKILITNPTFIAAANGAKILLSLNRLLELSDKTFKGGITKLMNSSDMTKFFSILSAKAENQVTGLFISYIRFKLKWDGFTVNDQILNGFKKAIFDILQKPLQVATDNLAESDIQLNDFGKAPINKAIEKTELLITFYRKLANTNEPLVINVKSVSEIPGIKTEVEKLRIELSNLLIAWCKTNAQTIEFTKRFSYYIYEAIANNDDRNRMEALYKLVDQSKISEFFAKPVENFTPIYFAAATHATRCLTMLLSILDELVDETSFGITPLYIAAAHGSTEVVMLLLRHKADPDRKMVNGWTPLMIASYNRHTEVVKELLNSKENPYKYPRNKLTPSDISTKQGYRDIVMSLTSLPSGSEASTSKQDSTLKRTTSGSKIISPKPGLLTTTADQTRFRSFSASSSLLKTPKTPPSTARNSANEAPPATTKVTKGSIKEINTTTPETSVNTSETNINSP